MIGSHARRIGALILGTALAFAATAALAQTPPPPTTAPTPGTEVKQVTPSSETPKVASPPTPAQGSTAVPGWNKPPADWNKLSEEPQYASIPGRETNLLIQVEGREWRAFRHNVVTMYGGWLIAGVFALIMIYYLIKGPIKLHGQPTGRLIERFDAVERTTHWVMAICFVLLAVSGVIILWGKYIILPWLGYTGFAWLTIFSKNMHNFVGPLFIFSLVVLALLFVKDNFFKGYDIKWLSKAGGMLGGPEMPSGRFNGGEKLWFWGGVVFLGAAVSITGIILDFPNWNQIRNVMQEANMVHAIVAILFICGAMGHTYLGSIGMQGAYKAMRDGYVDEQWAKEHHLYWYEEVRDGKRPERIMPAGGAPAPAPGDD
jgi:formate dehydrogenase subunit gamma